LRKYITIFLIFILILSIINVISLKPASLGDSITNSVIDIDNPILNQIKKASILKNLNKVNGFFTENCGQLKNDYIRFYAQGGGFWFTDDGMWMEVREQKSDKYRESKDPFDPMCKFSEPVPMEYKRVILKQEFIGANKVRPVGREKMGWCSNFFYGNDSSKWRTNVPNYQEIYYENIYDGIDLRYYTNEKGLKYDFIVHPGGEPYDIRMKYKGTQKLYINTSGDLEIKTQLRKMIDSELFIYQKTDIEKKTIEGKFIIMDSMIYGFEISSNYEKSKDLIIDPLIYSTFMGGIYHDYGTSITIDVNNNVYVTGLTTSTNFPNTTGAYDNIFNGKVDAYAFKLNPNGSSLIYSTYFGGSEWDHGYEIEIDSNCNTYITGRTNSTDFPINFGAFDTIHNGDFDVFVIKLNSDGSSLMYSTYIGGNSYDHGSDISIDSNNNAYITGWTQSFDFPITFDAYDITYNGGFWGDLFVLKLNPTGSSLIYSTFIGGNKSDLSESIIIDSKNNAIVTGSTNSTDFPITNGVFDDTYNGNYDIFVFKLDSTGSLLLYSTFIGGVDEDRGSCITIDSSGNVYVSGTTTSSDFPTTLDAYDNTNNDSYDVFVFKLNRIGTSLLYSTFVGGMNNEDGADIVIDLNNNIYVSGATLSPDFPTTTDAYDNELTGQTDVIVFKLNPVGSSLIYSTYVGGSELWETAHSLVIDVYGNMYVTGITESPDFPNTTGAFDNTFNSYTGYFDIFVFKLNIPINNSFPSVLDLKISEPQIYRTNPVKLYSNAFDIEDLEKNLTPFFIEYRDPNELIWNMSHFSNLQYNNSQWEISFTPPKNAILGLYDFRIMVNDTDQLYSPWFYLNDSLTVLNNIPSTENIFLSENKAILGDNISIWVNCTDIENPEENLTIRLEYKQPNEQFWETTYLNEPKYFNDRWEINFSIPANLSFGYYDFRARVNDSDGDYCQWLYANNSLLVYNEPPTVIDIQLSDNYVYRTNSVFLYVNGIDHETPIYMLKLYGQYKAKNENIWTDLTGNYSTHNNRWEIEFNTFKDTMLGMYDFRVRFEDNESALSCWHYLNDSLEVMNNIPIISDINVSNDNVYRTQSITISVNGTDVETPEELLICKAQYKSSSGNWLNISNINFNIDHLEIKFIPTTDAELGTYDLRINFTDIDNDNSSWMEIENAFEVKNNLPMISDLCTNFKVDFQPIEFDLTPYEFDIEDSGDNLTWGIDQATVNTTLFSASIVDILEDILRLIPKNNISGSDNISLVLNDKDGGHITKSDVTIFVNNKISHYYNVNITVTPKSIKMVQGKSQDVTLTITNIGTLSDNYTIIFESNKFTAGNILFEKNVISLSSGNLKNVNVTISIPKDMKSDEYRITFIVKSDHAIDETILTINVEDNKNKEDNVLVFVSIWIIIIFIISLMAVSGFYYYSRKKHAKQKPTLPEENIIKSTLDSRQDKTLMDESTSFNLKQPAGSTKEDNNAQQMQAAITPSPPLAKPTQIIQTTAPQQIPQVTSQPQLQSTESQPKLGQEILLDSPQSKPIISEKSTVTTQDAELKYTNDIGREEE